MYSQNDTNKCGSNSNTPCVTLFWLTLAFLIPHSILPAPFSKGYEREARLRWFGRTQRRNIEYWIIKKDAGKQIYGLAVAATEGSSWTEKRMIDLKHVNSKNFICWLIETCYMPLFVFRHVKNIHTIWIWRIIWMRVKILWRSSGSPVAWSSSCGLTTVT